MANDKDFVVNGPVVVGKDTKVTVGTVTSGAVDLSTGNYFTDSPSGDYTYTFTNPGAVQAFQIEATGGSAAVASTFNTTLYTGNGATQTVTNGIDLAGEGGMVWTKSRSSAGLDHYLTDSSIGDEYYISSNLTTAITGSWGPYRLNFTSTGYDLGSNTGTNSNNETFVSWTFKKQAKFFDIVTYTGTSAVQNISHSLGSAPGMIIVKCTNTAKNWGVYHRSVGSTKYLQLNTTAEANINGGFWNNTDPTSTQFTLGTASTVNGSGNTYVAYIFAHDTASDGLIQCGSYTGNSSTDGPEINLGWQPQWLLIKDTTGSQGAWVIFDTARGIVTSDVDPVLQANLSNAEYAGTNYLDALSNGFKLTVGGGSYGTTQDTHVNYTGHTYIYMAIRSASAPAITWPTSIEWTQGTTPKTPAEGATDVYTFTTDDGGTTYTGIQSIDTAS